MNKKRKNQNPWVIRNRLNELKLRLNQVASSWTVNDYEAFLSLYVRLLPKVMDAERCTIYIIEMGTEHICSRFGTGIETSQIRPPRKGSLVGKAILSGKGVVNNELDRSEGYHTLMDAQTGFVTRNAVCYPIKSITGHGVTGAIQILNKKKGHFGSADLNLLEDVSHYLSTSIESIILNQEILRISKQLEKEYERFDRGYLLDTTFIAESPRMEEVLHQARLVSETPVNVLIQGENGTGKELIARMIHEQSSRRFGPFVAVNCAAIPDNLMESEFFGFEKGAFTGAFQQRKGRFEEAEGGTLFLDEIADMSLRIQPKFLRAIQENEGRRLGGTKMIGYDLRIISASNKDLQEAVNLGNFREDLFFRLFSMKIRCPSLKNRREDIIPLSATLLEDTCKRFNRKVAGFSPGVLKKFEACDWPGNIRQLRREIERLVVLTPEGQRIESDKCSPEIIRLKNGFSREGLLSGGTLGEKVRDLEIRLISEALNQADNNKSNASLLLGITRQGLYKKMKRYGV